MNRTIHAVVFDAYGTLLDVNAAVLDNASSVGDRAGALAATWRGRQLEYSWTRALMDRYADFWEITQAALDYTLRLYCLEHDEALRESLLQSYFSLRAHGDSLPALKAIAESGVAIAVLSNGTNDMLESALKAGGLRNHIGKVLSVDGLKTYKPDPKVYQYACDCLDVAAENILFVSCNLWDLAGASSFGFQTARVNRDGGPVEYEFAQLGVVLTSLTELPQYVDEQIRR